MTCRECGTEIADKALICFRCGASVTEPVHRPYVAKKERSPIAYLILLVLIVLGMLIAYFSGAVAVP